MPLGKNAEPLNRHAMPHRPIKIVSGGQTGVDRAALDFAIESEISHGGWCPAGRVAEDGSIADQYQLTETNVRSYPARTKMNVRDSDATLILYRKPMGSGTALTMRIARQTSKPLLVIQIDQFDSAKQIIDWLDDHRPQVLNVAGPRESGCPGIHVETRALLATVFR